MSVLRLGEGAGGVCVATGMHPEKTMTRTRVTCVAAVSAVLSFTTSAAWAQQSSTLKPAGKTIVERVDAQRLSFEERRREADGPATFVSHGLQYTLRLTSAEAALAVPTKGGARAPILTMTLSGASSAGHLIGLEPLPGKIYHVDGRSHGPLAPRDTFSRVRAAGVYPGIDLDYYGSGGVLEFDFIVAPHADPRSIRMSFAGSDRIALTRRGAAVLTTAGGEVQIRKPLIYQEHEGVRRVIEGRYVLEGRTLRFALGKYDRSLPLVIDPVIDYATYIGSPEDDKVVAIRANAQGEVYVFGSTMDFAGFPFTTFAGTTPSGSTEKCFVSKFDATGATLLFSVILQDTAAVTSAGYRAFCDAMTLGPDGRIHVVHQSADLGTFVKTLKTFSEAQPSGLSLFQERLLAHEGFLPAPAIEADAAGHLYVLGGCYNERVQAPGPVLPNGFRTSPRPGHCISPDNFFSLGVSESVLVKYSTSGDIMYGTFIGGSNDDHTAATSIAVSDANGTAEVFVAGRTRSTDLFPVPPDAPGVGYLPYQSACATAGPGDPCADAFFTRIDTLSVGAASHRYSTYLGGADGIDGATAVAVQSRTVPLAPGLPATQTLHRVFITGATDSADFPQTVPGISGQGVFAAVFDVEFGQPVYLTKFGGTGIQVPTSIAVFRQGELAIAGNTDSADFPVVDSILQEPPSGTCSADGCGFVTVLSTSGDSIRLSTYLDYTGETSSPQIAVDLQGNLYVGATTTATGLATPGAFQETLDDGRDGLIMKIGAAVPPLPNQYRF